MHKKFIIANTLCVAFLICFTASCISTNSTKTYARMSSKIEIGQSKQTVQEALGQPDTIIKDFIKNNKYIWGPQEEFWDKIPMGAKLEIWDYSFSDGHLSLYFVNGSETLNYLAFAPKGVVY